jgi:twitching motility protein PilT
LIEEENTKLFEQLLMKMIELGASDLHLIHNNEIVYRVDGRIEKMDKRIKGTDIFKILNEVKALNELQISNLHTEKSADFAYEFRFKEDGVNKKVRFRGSLTKEKNQYTCVVRRLSDKVVPLVEMGLPEYIKQEIKKSEGLILVTGPTGSGKTTTLTSLIDHINENYQKHITTIEEPIEYVHRPKKSIITQQEVGRDTPTFAKSMRSILRRDPDVILIGEMRDLETIETACIAAETGHLVFGTLHTNTAISSIDRITSIFPALQQQNIRSQLASNLKMIINQRLLPKIGGGRVPAYEILLITKEMRKAIREGRLEDIEELMEQGRDKGNILMQDSIERLKREGLIDPDNIF